jgi:hypothetical protein
VLTLQLKCPSPATSWSRRLHPALATRQVTVTTPRSALGLSCEVPPSVAVQCRAALLATADFVVDPTGKLQVCKGGKSRRGAAM